MADWVFVNQNPDNFTNGTALLYESFRILYIARILNRLHPEKGLSSESGGAIQPRRSAECSGE
jgi:hypothetical protein